MATGIKDKVAIIGMAFFHLAGYETKATQVNLASQRAKSPSPMAY